MTIALRATYRLQLRNGVDFAAARRRLPYLARLGVSHLYLSPILHARTGSTHGYDAIDPGRIDPSLGGEQGFRALAEAARAHGLGLVVDIVPNHMAADPESPQFADILRFGPASPWAHWFDIDWGPRVASGRHAPLVLPVLGMPTTRAMATGAMRLARVDGRIVLLAHERAYPLDPASLGPLLEAAATGFERGPRRHASRERLTRLVRACRSISTLRQPGDIARVTAARDVEQSLEAVLDDSPALARGVDAAIQGWPREALARLHRRQPWRLGHWREARHRIIHRRFFDVSELIALRSEDPDVFAQTHACILEQVGAGRIDGLRVDHIDGLYDPAAWLRHLGGALADRGRPDLPVFVEKILGPGERLPGDWRCRGTTGYELLTAIDESLHDPVGVARVQRAWQSHIGRFDDFETVALASRRHVLDDLFRPELRRLLRCIAPRAGAPFRAALERALREVSARLDVYRTYADRRRGLRQAERERIRRALDAAARRCTRAAMTRLERALLPKRPDEGECLRRWQQLTGPVAAKGVEDTALYRFTPLLSRNEVGTHPGAPDADAPATLHRLLAATARSQRPGLLAVSTHDTKRSADVRARLAVLAEMPERWRETVVRWRARHAALRMRLHGREVPDPATEDLLYQTLLGIWPATRGRRLPPVSMAELADRVEACLLKSMREARRHTRWTRPDTGYESATCRFLRRLIGNPDIGFTAELQRLVDELEPAARSNSLARTAIALAGPAVPDVYQGDESWNHSLVDPDNRRPVDFPALARRLGAGHARKPLDAAHDGAKLLLVHRLLQLRRSHPDLLVDGGYEPLAAVGPLARHVFAFARRVPGWCLVVAVVRLPFALARADSQAMRTTALEMPQDANAFHWRDPLARGAPAETAPRDGRIGLDALFARVPVAVRLGRGHRPRAVEATSTGVDTASMQFRPFTTD